MAVIFAVVGGGAIIGIANSDSHDYSDYEDYEDYGDYSNYSDAAERRKRRMDAKKKEIAQDIQEINQYKIDRVNDFLKNKKLISESGECVSVDSVKKDGDEKIDREEKKKVDGETRSIQKELNEIEAVISAIDRILEEKRDENV